MTRAFIAIDLPFEATNEIERIAKLIWKKTLFSGKITESANLHLTLKFLGEISDEQVLEVKKRLSEIKFSEFSCEFGGVGVFNREFIRIIWIKLNGSQNSKNFGTSKTKSFESKGIWDLQKQIDEVLSKPQTFALGGKASSDEKLLGLFEKEARFMSHITIARVKNVANKSGFLEYLKSVKPKNIKFNVCDFVLKKSELLPAGPVYSDIERYTANQ